MEKLIASVIIPVRTITPYVKETVDYLKKQSEKKFEIIVVTDKEEKLAGVKVIASQEPTPAYKRNLGAKIAKGEILAFLDDDSYPSQNWLKSALEVFQLTINKPLKRNSFEMQQLAISGVCGPTLTPPTDNVYQKASGWVWASWLGSGGAGVYRNREMSQREVDDFPSVNLLVRKADFNKVGGFDIKHWPGEDSLPPDEEVVIIDQLNTLKRIKIGDLVDKHLNDSKSYKDRKSEVSYENSSNLKVFSFNSDYKIRVKPIKAFIRHKKFHKVYELTLSRGNQIKLTDSHSLFTLNGDGKIIPVKVKELKRGNLVVTPRKISVSKDVRKINTVQLLLGLENKFIYSRKFSALYLRSKGYISYLLNHYKKEILEIAEEYNLKGDIRNWKYYGYLPLIVLKKLPTNSYSSRLLEKFGVKIRARGHGNVVSMKPLIPLDEDLLWFLGFISAEGWMSDFRKIKSGNRWNVSISQRMKNRAVLDRARQILQSHLGLSFRMYKDKRYNVLNIVVNCRVLWCFLRALGLKGYSYQKRVPSFIFSLPERKIKAFLDGYHAGDPCDYTDGRLGKFGITTSSPEMAKDFALLFLRLGEPFRITEHKEIRKPHFHNQFNIHTFCPSVEKLGVNTYLRISRNLQDGIPAIDYLLKIARNYHLTSKLITNGITPQYRNLRDNRKKVTWYHVKQFVKAVKQAIGNVPEIENLERLLNSDLRFEEILEIKKVKNQPRYVYDLSVGGNPGSDNFIAGTFICAHNTKLCLDLTKKLGKKIIYDPKVLVYHHRRPILVPHLKQISRYAKRRGFFAKKFPETSFRLGYLLPSFFAYGLLLGGVISLFFWQLRFLYFLLFTVYCLLLTISGFEVLVKEKNLYLAVLVPLSIFATHLVYGFLFPFGYFKKELSTIPHKIDFKKKKYIGG